MIAVSDTACGMDANTKSRAFEPFFTTREDGQGTGLGLSTAYGIVKQSGGNVWIYSEPGGGSTFKVYLPRAKQDVEPSESEVPNGERGLETVLLAEDEESLRKMIREVLEAQGHTVLDAGDGREALSVSERYDGPIHAMITDVVMPQIGGSELAERLSSRRPNFKILYVSGYADNAILHHGILAPGVHFIQKPFAPEGLTSKLRKLLGSTGSLK